MRLQCKENKRICTGPQASELVTRVVARGFGWAAGFGLADLQNNRKTINCSLQMTMQLIKQQSRQPLELPFDRLVQINSPTGQD